MKNLKFKGNDKEVFMCDTVLLITPSKDNTSSTHREVIVSEDTIPFLISVGIIQVINIKEEGKKEIATYKPNIERVKADKSNLSVAISDTLKLVHTSISHYEFILAKKVAGTSENLTIVEAVEYIKAIKHINKGAYFSLILKEIAVALDSQYPDHISNSPRLYTISSATGNPYFIEPGFLKSTNTIGLFRSEVDAIVAIKILAPLKKEIFSGRRK
jgi:hypothetical protein